MTREGRKGAEDEEGLFSLREARKGDERAKVQGTARVVEHRATSIAPEISIFRCRAAVSSPVSLFFSPRVTPSPPPFQLSLQVGRVCITTRAKSTEILLAPFAAAYSTRARLTRATRVCLSAYSAPTLLVCVPALHQPDDVQLSRELLNE